MNSRSSAMWIYCNILEACHNMGVELSKVITKGNPLEEFVDCMVDVALQAP